METSSEQTQTDHSTSATARVRVRGQINIRSRSTSQSPTARTDDTMTGNELLPEELLNPRSDQDDHNTSVNELVEAFEGGHMATEAGVHRVVSKHDPDHCVTELVEAFEIGAVPLMSSDDDYTDADDGGATNYVFGENVGRRRGGLSRCVKYVFSFVDC